MGHIVFGAPGLDRFHLHDRLQRELRTRGHRVETLLVDPVAHAFWRQQGLPATLLLPAAMDAMRAPLAEFAAEECRRRGLCEAGPRWRSTLARTHRELARLLPPLVRWFQTTRPDLVLLHRPRGALASLVQFVATETGSRVLWTGDGLLPHTMQFDDRGLDAAASATRRAAVDYRMGPHEPDLLHACLSHVLARTAPAALTRRELQPPPLWRRLATVLPALRRRGLPGIGEAMFAWASAASPTGGLEAWRGELPAAPHVTVLLQDADDERVRCDGGVAPTPPMLVAGAAAAARVLDPAIQTVVVLPHRGIHHTQLRAITALDGVTVVPAHAAPEAAALAVATFTVNHPLAVVALLAGTPVLHTGSALYGLPGVTHRTPVVQFADTLPIAVNRDQPTLRERFLSWLLGHGHVWCSAVDPDHNGLCGLVQEIEARLGRSAARAAALRYRAGPPWPLAAKGREA